MHKVINGGVPEKFFRNTAGDLRGTRHRRAPVTGRQSTVLPTAAWAARAGVRCAPDDSIHASTSASSASGSAGLVRW